MAFQQPARQALQRVIAGESNGQEGLTHQTPGPSPNESQTWVVFSPVPDTNTASLIESSISLPTLGRSRLSDLGSIHTIARSGQDTGSLQSARYSGPISARPVDDDAELDSLDSHLPEFRTAHGAVHYASPVPAFGLPVLPTHDGLGSFRAGVHPANTNLQEQIFAFEKYNPRRVRRRRESSEKPAFDLTREEVQEIEKAQRVEEWRLEQSRILLEEVHKETRRRGLSQSSSPHPELSQFPRQPDNTGSVVDRKYDKDVTRDWHEEDDPDAKIMSGGLLSQNSREVIQDVLGIDDKLLAILFGEASLDEGDSPENPRASTFHVSNLGGESIWQIHTLDRVARELGLLLGRLPHPHPGAFSTYNRMQHTQLPYGGLPAIPEAAVDPTLMHSEEVPAQSVPEFGPTMGKISQPSGVVNTVPQDLPVESGRDEFTQEEWEKDLDIKLVFRYLRSRFGSRNSSSLATAGTSHLAMCSTQDTAAKAARVRLHHPLISSRTRPSERRTFKATTPSSPVALRHASSCASQSTRRSARRSSCSSRHYWDIGGSLGTGSPIPSNGPMGSWGEI